MAVVQPGVRRPGDSGHRVREVARLVMDVPGPLERYGGASLAAMAAGPSNAWSRRLTQRPTDGG